MGYLEMLYWILASVGAAFLTMKFLSFLWWLRPASAELVHANFVEVFKRLNSADAKVSAAQWKARGAEESAEALKKRLDDSSFFIAKLSERVHQLEKAKKGAK